jgi:hypothetical protein
LVDKNKSFSGALRQLQGLEGLLNLLESPQWGPCLCDLDGVSVVGALVVLVRSSEWQQLQRQQRSAGAQQQQQQVLRQRGENAVQVGGGERVLPASCCVVYAECSLGCITPGVLPVTGTCSMSAWDAAALPCRVACANCMRLLRGQCCANRCAPSLSCQRLCTSFSLTHPSLRNLLHDMYLIYLPPCRRC